MKRLLLILLVIFFGCKPEGKKTFVNPDLITIKIDSLKQIDELKLDKIIYIPLETTERCLIGDITKIMFHNNYFYIADFIYSKAVYVFDLDGKFVNRIGIYGKGPGEVIEPRDFDLDEEGNIYLYDNMSKKIVLYSVKGEVLKVFDVPIRFMEFSFIKEGEVFFRNNIGEDKLPLTLGLIDLNKNIYYVNLESRKVFDDSSIINYSRHYFFRSNSTVFYNQRFTGNIYSLMQDGTITRTISIIGCNFPDESFVSKLTDDRVLWENPSIIWDIRDIYENNGMTTLMISKGYFEEIRVLYSNKSEVSFSYRELDKRIYLGNGYIRGVADDCFISIIESSDYNAPNWSDRIKQLDLPASEKQKLGKLSEGSNPTLVLFTIAQF